MIQKINKNEIQNCVKVIRKSFMTVADEFGFTIENAPRFTAFATTKERLIYQMEQEQRLINQYVISWKQRVVRNISLHCSISWVFNVPDTTSSAIPESSSTPRRTSSLYLRMVPPSIFTTEAPS